MSEYQNKISDTVSISSLSLSKTKVNHTKTKATPLLTKLNSWDASRFPPSCDTKTGEHKLSLNSSNFLITQRT